MPMQARKNYVIVEDPRDEQKTTQSGIIITSQFNKQEAYGVVCNVISVGEEVADIEAGDRVFINYWDGTPFDIESKTYIGIKADQVMAKLSIPIP